MEEIYIAAETVVKIEEIKQEYDDSVDNTVWNITEQSEPTSLKTVIKKEVEEGVLEPPLAVFVEPSVERVKEEESEDPLAGCSGGTPVTEEESHMSAGGASATTGASRESQAPEGSGRERACGGPSISTMKRWDPYLVCPVCNKSFAKTSSLIYHSRFHTGEKNYHCPVCQKSFVSSRHLVAHMHVHEERKYHCSVCQKSFTRKESLVNHMHIHIRQRNKYCSVCLKHFRYKSNFVKHMLTHAGKKNCIVKRNVRKKK